MSQRQMPKPYLKPDPRAVALRVLSAYLREAGGKPLADRGAMPAPPRGPAGGVAFPQTRSPFPGTPPISPMPFPRPPRIAAPAHGRPSAMDVIARFLEASRARGGRR